LKYSDHDLTDENKFPQFKKDNYLNTEHGRELISPIEWVAPIYRSTILNALRLPHFGRSLEINVVVKVLLCRVHGGYIWLDSRISLDPHLLARLTKLSKQGIDPSTVFIGKTQDKQLAETLKTRFKLKKMG